MRFGAIAIYQGKEFDITPQDDEKNFELFTRNPQAKTMGFVEDKTHPGVYCKIVKRKAIETAYGIDNNARYKGHDFGVLPESRYKEKENKILIIGGDEELAKKLGMEMTDRYVYEKWIDIDEAEMIWEERKPIYGFQLPEGMKPLEIIKKK